MFRDVKRGDLLMVNFGNNVGSVQGGVRPAIVVQNNIGNKFSPTILVIPITSKSKNNLPTHVYLNEKDGLDKPSTAMTEQVSTIDKKQIVNKIGRISPMKMKQVNKALMISFAVDNEAESA